MFLSELLHPIHPDKFRGEILGKRFHYWRAPVGSSDRYQSLYSWQNFEDYLNNRRIYVEKIFNSSQSSKSLNI